MEKVKYPLDSVDEDVDDVHGTEVPQREDTPGPYPQFQYSREKLLDLSEGGAAKLRPKCLLKAYDNADGLWDPERWFRSLGGFREESPLTVMDSRDRKRPMDMDRETLLRRRPSDPRERLKEERDGIVLSPQRRSFGTGCHVSQSSSLLNRQVSCPAEFKEGSDRDRERRERRIGSGRIQIDRDQGREREREYRVRDRYERDDRRGNSVFDRNERFSTNYDNNRPTYNRSYSTRDARGGRRRLPHHEEEPEWFTSGPTSQSDTIELRGFEKEGSDHEHYEEEEQVQEEEEEQTETQNKDKTGGISVVDRNGSLETNESSSPEASHSDAETRPSPTASSLFDFNEFFKVNNIPGLADDSVTEREVAATGSRFSQWFMSQTGHNASKENSRRSSLNEEFGYLNEIIDGSKSPVVPSPPPPTAVQLFDKGVFFSPFPMNMEEKQASLDAVNSSQKNAAMNPVLNALFMNNSGNLDKSNLSSGGGNFSTQDAEAQLKAMLFGGRKDSASSSGTASPANISAGGQRRVKTLAELEAGFHQVNSPQRVMSPSPQEVRHHEEGDLTAFNKLLSMMKAGAAATVSGSQDQSKPQMMPVEHMRPISPVPGTQGVSNHLHNDFIQALLRNKEQQLHIQQQTLQHMRIHQPHMHPQQQPQQQQQAPQPSPQQMLPATQSGGSGPRPLTQDPILNFIQQNPTIITKPPSPTPSIPNLMQNTSTPRIVSPIPQIVPPNLLPKTQQVQQTPGGKIPSPIMFSQQPPMHLNAPSPIHPAQLSRSLASQTLSANTLSTTSNIHPQSMARVPSPQELIAHTQAIMQSALIKKQLEDQKERFLRKQQERARSPNQFPVNRAVSGSVTPSSPGQVKPTMSVAFTPTSVIRKMHSDRVSEKEKQSKDPGDSPVQQAPIRHLVKPDGTLNIDEGEDEGHRMIEGEERKFDVGDVSQSDLNIMSLPGINFGNDTSQAMLGLEDKMKMSGISTPMSQPPPQPGHGQSVVNKATPILGQADKPLRPLVGQGMMQNNIPIQVQTVVNSTPAVQGRPIVKDTTSIQQLNLRGLMNLSTLAGVNTTAPVTVASPGPPRPVTGGMGSSVPSQRPDGQRAIVGTNSGAALDVTKMLEQQRLQQQQPQTRQVGTPLGRNVGVTATPPYGIPITGRMPVQSNVPPPQSVQQAAANALLMQQMMQNSLAPAAARVTLNQLNQLQLNPFNQLAALQAQQRMVDPRLQGVRYPGGVPPMLSPRSSAGTNIGLGASGNPAVNAVLGRALSPQILPGGQKLNLNGPVSPNLPPGSSAQFGVNPSLLNGNNNISKSADPNILKWFSPDVLKNQLPTMPPLPAQGQRVLTLDDLEGAQQAVMN